MGEQRRQIGRQAGGRRPLAAQTLTQAIERAHRLIALARIERAEPDLGIEQAFATLNLEWQPQLPREPRTGHRQTIGDAVKLDVVERVVPIGIGEFDAAVEEARMILEIAADQVVAIADAGRLLPIRRQQQTCVLDATGREHESAGLDRKVGSAERANPDQLDRAAPGVALNVDDIGPQHQRYMPRRHEIGAVFAAQIQGRTEVRDDVLDLRRIERQPQRLEPVGLQTAVGRRIDRIDPVGRPIVLRRHFQDTVRAGVEGFEVGASDRPATGVDPVTRLEGVLVPGAAEAAPAIAAAAQETAARSIGEVIVQTDAVTPIQISGRFIANLAAAFEQDAVDAGPLELERHRDAGGTGADDADLGFERLPGQLLACVDQHFGVRRRAAHTASRSETRRRKRDGDDGIAAAVHTNRTTCSS